MRWLLILLTLGVLSGMAFFIVTDAPVEAPVWWLINDTPPEVEIVGPEGTVRGDVMAAVRFEPADRAHVVAATLNGEPFPLSGNRLNVDTTRLPDGFHQVQVLVRDTSRARNETSASWSFVTDNTPPALDVSYDPGTGPVEGKTLSIRVRANEPLSLLEGSFDERTLRWQTAAEGVWALAGVSPGTSASELPLEVRVVDQVGNEARFEQMLPLTNTEFVEEELFVDESMANLTQADVRAAEMERLQRVYAGESETRLWDGKFGLPTPSSIVTTEFGSYRAFSGGTRREYHTGVDYGAPQGESVLAPAAATVAFAETVDVRGNTVVLDHGAGVFTTYAHLDSMAVEVGAYVRAGQRIGLVGNTGLSTGPHLHWEMWVNQANVDPLEWTRREFP